MALVAGLLQIVASIALGLARLDHFAAAANERPTVYLVAAVLIAGGALTVWLVRQRPAIAVALALAWSAGLIYGLRGHASLLGLAYHGEFILHHFSALLCVVVAIRVPIAWAQDPRLGRLRFVPALLAVPGALALVGAHLGRIPVGPEWFTNRWLATGGAALILGSWPAAVACFWSRLGPTTRRPIAVLLLLPIVVRLAFAGVHGLSGELVDPSAISWVGGAIVVTAIGTMLLLRPRTDRRVMVIVGLICLLGTMFFYYLYEHGFGELEDGLGGLLQSLLGFQVPYPSYVDDLHSAALMMGLFFMFVTVYSTLVSAEDRIRGIALGLMVIAGLGLSSPHLALMLGVGALLFIETLLPGAPHRDLRGPELASWDELAAELESHDDPAAASASASITSIHACLESLAERLGLEPPTLVETGPGAAMIGLRGDLDGPVLDLRARIEGSSTRIELSLGLPGRGDPVFELVPEGGQRGKRPAHLLARSHRVAGELRALESFGDAPLDALTSFPSSYLRAWEGGVSVDLGREIHGLRVDHLEALIRALAKTTD